MRFLLRRVSRDAHLRCELNIHDLIFNGSVDACRRLIDAGRTWQQVNISVVDVYSKHQFADDIITETWTVPVGGGVDVGTSGLSFFDLGGRPGRLGAGAGAGVINVPGYWTRVICGAPSAGECVLFLGRSVRPLMLVSIGQEIIQNIWVVYTQR